MPLSLRFVFFVVAFRYGTTMNEESKSKSSSGQASTSSSNSVGARDDVKGMTTEEEAEAGDTDDNCKKEEERSTTDNNSSAKKKFETNNVDDDFITTQPQPPEATFPQQLMELIERETVDDNAATINGHKAIEWLPEGDKFIIRCKSTVEKCVLNKYFKKKSKFMSFVRKLYR